MLGSRKSPMPIFSSISSVPWALWGSQLQIPWVQPLSALFDARDAPQVPPHTALKSLVRDPFYLTPRMDTFAAQLPSKEPTELPVFSSLKIWKTLAMSRQALALLLLWTLLFHLLLFRNEHWVTCYVYLRDHVGPKSITLWILSVLSQGRVPVPDLSKTLQPFPRHFIFHV